MPHAPDVTRLIAALEQPELIEWSGDGIRALRDRLAWATVTRGPGPARIMDGDRPLGRVLPFGSVVLHQPVESRSLGPRLLELDRHGHVMAAMRRGPGGAFQGVRVEAGDGSTLAVVPGGADHPLWGPSDRIVRLHKDTGPEPLTVCGAVCWDAITGIPPLADPTRLPAGAGTAILQVLAGLAMDQDARALRYAGPYPTEDLFWALLESFRFDDAVAEPLASFTRDAEAAFMDGRVVEARLAWTPAPAERLCPAPGLCVQLRDGVEKVGWAGRLYYRPEWQGLRRREHRVIRRTEDADGTVRFVASLEALGRPVEDHVILDATGNLVTGPGEPADRGDPRADTAVGEPWRAALGALLPLDATPLLATAIEAVWPSLTLVWGSVPWDLVELRGTTLRLSARLADLYRIERAARSAAARRSFAQGFVREVLGLIGPPVRRAAATWLEAEPTPRREARLAEAAARDRATTAARALEPLARLLTMIEAGLALPARGRPRA